MPTDPWIGSGGIKCDIDEDEHLDINGKPQREAVGQVAITITELREGDWTDFELIDHVGQQGTRCGSTCFGYDADSVLLQSISVQQVKHSLSKWTYKFLHDSKNFLDQIPFQRTLSGTPLPLGIQTTIIAADASANQDAVNCDHFLAVWSSPYRVGTWTPTSIGLDDTYYANLVVGGIGPD